jgi:hypothetical protein|tara:strand:- start:383 stop:805 length:423 start_codon:yes stop_codon:yes gene_type:complete
MPTDMPYKSKNNDEDEMADAEMAAPMGDEMGGGELMEEEALPEEGMELEGEGEAPVSLETGVQDLIAQWQPTTPEGEQYKADLEGLMAEMGGPMEDVLGEGLEEGPPGGDEGLKPSAFGFSVGLMGKEAAKRAMGGPKGA